MSALQNEMANQPSPDKRVLSIRIPRTLYLKLSILAEKYGLALSEVCTVIFEKETENIELTAEHYEQIAREIRTARASAGARKPRNQSTVEGKS